MPLKIVKRHASRNYYIRGTVRGVAVDESTGTDNAEIAEALRIKRENEILESSVYGRQTTATWLEAAVSYLETKGDEINSKDRRYQRRLMEHFGKTKLSKIDQAAIDRAAATLYPGCAKSTINRQVHTPISSVLKHAAKRGLCGHWNLDRPKQPRGRVRWLTLAEADRLIDSAALHLQPLLVFMFYTGARVSEALYLDWVDVDLNRAHASLKETKGGEPRGVPLHPRVIARLADLPHRDGAVFLTHMGRPYAYVDKEHGGQIKRAFSTALKRARIADFTPHDCRHTWATWHYQANRDLRGLQQLGGWKSLKMVERYTHVNVDDLASSVEALPWGKSGKLEKSSSNNKERSAC